MYDSFFQTIFIVTCCHCSSINWTLLSAIRTVYFTAYFQLLVLYSNTLDYTVISTVYRTTLKQWSFHFSGLLLCLFFWSASKLQCLILILFFKVLFLFQRVLHSTPQTYQSQYSHSDSWPSLFLQIGSRFKCVWPKTWVFPKSNYFYIAFSLLLVPIG